MKPINKLVLYLCFLIGISYSAQAQIVISEIFYDSPGPDSLEFFEIHNPGDITINLGGYEIVEGVYFVFPDYNLEPGAYLVLARHANYVNNFFNLTTPALQWTEGALSNDGEEIKIIDSQGNVVDSVYYRTDWPWDPSAAGTGPSLILCDYDSDNSRGYNWGISEEADFAGNFTLDGRNDPIYASPGRAATECNAKGDIYPPIIQSVITTTNIRVEIRFDEPLNQFIAENTGNYSISNRTITSASVLDNGQTVRLQIQNTFETGRFYTLTISNIQDMAGNVMPQAQYTIVFNDTKASLRITEIMYDNPGPDELEFIEIYNNSSQAANIGGYETRGVRYQFPSMTTIGAHAYVVLVYNKAEAEQFYGITGTFQWTTGGLSNDGERVAIINSIGEFIDSVNYGVEEPWPQEARGNGSSLMLCHPNAAGFMPGNWKTSQSFDDYIDLYSGVPVFANPGRDNGNFSDCIMNRINAQASTIGLYPNPNQGMFNLSIASNAPGRIEILNSMGSVVYTKEYQSLKDVNVDVTHLGLKGLYIVSIKEHNTHLTQTVKVHFE
ncbi:MAG: lamin tail domain-containing protein [Cytophagaceae bacterium]